MTENEAKQKWCPLGRVYHEKGSYNRTETRVAEGPSKCKGEPVPDYKGEHGYCGLAGPL